MSEPNNADSDECSMVLLGTGTSIGVPVVGCECEVCLSENPRNSRTRAGVLVNGPDGNFVIDTPPELRIQLVRERCKLVQAAIFTHAHADHIMGLDDLRIFGFRLEKDIPLLCEPIVEEQLRQSFNYAFSDGPKAHKFATPRLSFKTIGPDEPFETCGLKVEPIRLMHGKLPTLGFRFGNIAYCTDVSSIPADSMEQLQDLDVLIIDTLREEPHPTHMHLQLALNTIKKLKPKRAFLTHLSHQFDYDKANAMLPDGVQLAYDGLQLPFSV
jgi:phosphoribosyl 1,2-cyclic phosphate phosphodiesterase